MVAYFSPQVSASKEGVSIDQESKLTLQKHASWPLIGLYPLPLRLEGSPTVFSSSATHTRDRSETMKVYCRNLCVLVLILVCLVDRTRGKPPQLGVLRVCTGWFEVFAAALSLLEVETRPEKARFGQSRSSH